MINTRTTRAIRARLGSSEPRPLISSQMHASSLGASESRNSEKAKNIEKTNENQRFWPLGPLLGGIFKPLGASWEASSAPVARWPHTGHSAQHQTLSQDLNVHNLDSTVWLQGCPQTHADPSEECQTMRASTEKGGGSVAAALRAMGPPNSWWTEIGEL